MVWLTSLLPGNLRYKDVSHSYCKFEGECVAWARRISTPVAFGISSDHAPYPAYHIHVHLYQIEPETWNIVALMYCLLWRPR